MKFQRDLLFSLCSGRIFLLEKAYVIGLVLITECMLKNDRFVGFCVQRIDIFLASDFSEGYCDDNFMLVVENSRLPYATGGGHNSLEENC